MPIISYYKNWIPVIAVFLIITFWQDYKKILSVILLVTLVLAISDFINHRIIKAFFARTRPCNILDEVNLLVGCGRSFSFPSSHASNISALSTVIAYEYRKLAPIMFIIALLVCFSRVYLGVHYPFDVFIGGTLGSLYGIGLIKFKNRSKFKIFSYGQS